MPWRNRKPEPALAEQLAPAVDVVVAVPMRQRLTRQERETARIVAEQKRAAEAGRRAEAMEREARYAWERERPEWCRLNGVPLHPAAVDRSQFLY